MSPFAFLFQTMIHLVETASCMTESLIEIFVYFISIWLPSGLINANIFLLVTSVLFEQLNGYQYHMNNTSIIIGGDKIDGLETASVLKKSKKEKRLKDWEDKVLHSQYLRQTKEVRSDQCWAWRQNGDLKRETESLIMAAQNQSIRTNLVKARIDKSQGDSLCRVCRKVDESIDRIVSGCSKLAQEEKA